jgi:hypothetical protein
MRCGQQPLGADISSSDLDVPPQLVPTRDPVESGGPRYVPSAGVASAPLGPQTGLFG